MAYNRITLQQLARCRLEEAKVLAEENQPSGAQYLAGYAIECALKARIASQFLANEIPSKALVNRIYTHDLAELVRLAGLEQELKAAIESDPLLARRWSVIVKWTEEIRYQVCTDESASSMIEAVSGGEDGNGLFQWLTSRW
jgi:hypothetical protein